MNRDILRQIHGQKLKSSQKTRLLIKIQHKESSRQREARRAAAAFTGAQTGCNRTIHCSRSNAPGSLPLFSTAEIPQIPLKISLRLEHFHSMEKEVGEGRGWGGHSSSES